MRNLVKRLSLPEAIGMSVSVICPTVTAAFNITLVVQSAGAAAPLAFAIGTVFAESGEDDYRWVRRFIGYGMASATVYLRLHDNQHWVSDTIAGSAIGIASGRFSTHHRLERAKDWNLSLAPSQHGGAMLTFNMIVD